MAELRATAKKIRIKNILDASSIKENEINYFLTNNDKISRVNIVATIISDPVISSSFCQTTVDDGSGQIKIRNFDNKNFFGNIKIGDAIWIIGKPRQYNEEKYILGEIIKQIKNKKWCELRNLELMDFSEKKENKLNVPIGETNYNEILLLISDEDSGQGVEFDKLINEKGISTKALDVLLEKGKIFFIRPGIVKLLE